MRHPEPEFVRKWREHRGTPRCCHTCAFYTEGGMCEIFNSEPPIDFAQKEGACEKWKDEIPF